MYELGQKMDSQKAKNLNPVVLAFVGDAVFSLFVREKLTFNSDLKANQLNKLATAEVKATAQAELLMAVLPLFNDEELAIFKRARNAKKNTKAKHATVAEYNASTGLEAVVGYLHLIGDNERLNFLLNKGIKDEDWR